MSIVKVALVNGVPSWLDVPNTYKHPGKVVGTNLVIEYTGSIEHPVYGETWPIPEILEYRTRLRPGEILALLKDPMNLVKGSYARIYRAAYPHGAAPADDIALEFLEQARMPYSEDGMIDVTDIAGALAYFQTAPQNYIDQADVDRVMQGWPI